MVSAEGMSPGLWFEDAIPFIVSSNHKPGDMLSTLIISSVTNERMITTKPSSYQTTRSDEIRSRNRDKTAKSVFLRNPNPLFFLTKSVLKISRRIGPNPIQYVFFLQISVSTTKAGKYH